MMNTKGNLPLKGIKVADFGRLVNAPMAAKYLGDYGATVIEIESPQASRAVIFPFAGGVPGVNRSGTFATYASSKYSITLNFNHPEGLELTKRLIAWSDVLIENFAPGTMGKWGLGYEEVKKLKPDIIMVSSSMLGQTGPYRTQKGTGEQLSGLTSFAYLTGWQDRMPAGIPNAYTDFIAPFYILNAIVGALSYRQKTGKGLYIDLAQFEASMSFLSHLVLDYTANDKIQGALGNRSLYAAPHGAYLCKGEDRWCVIAVFTEEEWRSFCTIIGEPDWSKESKFATLQGRKENEDELDKLVGQWTINYSAEDVMKMMQGAGIAAGVVQNNEDVMKDPQLDYRHHFWMLEQPEMGLFAHEGSAFKLSKTPAEIRIPAPCYGEHTEYVCKEVLGISDEEFIRLFNNGAFTGPALEKAELSEKYFNKSTRDNIEKTIQ